MPLAEDDTWSMFLDNGRDNPTATGRFSELVAKANSGGATEAFVWRPTRRTYESLDLEAARVEGPSSGTGRFL